MLEGPKTKFVRVESLNKTSARRGRKLNYVTCFKIISLQITYKTTSINFGISDYCKIRRKFNFELPVTTQYPEQRVLGYEAS